MILEPLDVAVLRIAELYGLFVNLSELALAGLDWDAYRERVNRLMASGILRSFHLTLVVPPFLGGRWVWGAARAKTKANPEAVARKLTARLPFVTEIVLNASLPPKVGPNLALLFYSRDFETERRFIHSVAELQDVEVFKVQEFSYPVALPLSSEEKEFVKFLLENPAQPPDTLASALNKEERWVRARLDRLIWRESNPAGIIRIQSSINWSACDNFGHFHFLLETGYTPEELAKLLTDQGFKIVLGGRLMGGKLIGVETDVWGIGELFKKIELLEGINGVKVAGLLYNQEVIINNGWVKNLLR